MLFRSELSVKLLASHTFQTKRHPVLEITLEIYQAEDGSLVAVTASTLPGGTGRADERVTIVPPTDDVQGMRVAVMEALNWNVGAKSMVRKLGWKMRQDID